MTSDRRGFFATLLALPAVVMGRRAIGVPKVIFVDADKMPPWSHSSIYTSSAIAVDSTGLVTVAKPR